VATSRGGWHGERGEGVEKKQEAGDLHGRRLGSEARRRLTGSAQPRRCRAGRVLKRGLNPFPAAAVLQE
jgi:hypothetical protein